MSSLQKSVSEQNESMKLVDPCHFPVLNDGIEVTAQKFEIGVPIAASFHEISQFCESQGINVTHLIKAAWAIALHHFIGAPDVCFGASMLHANEYGRTSRRLELCSAEIRGDLLITELLNAMKTTTMDFDIHSQGLSEPTFNTLLSIVEDYETIEETLERYPGVSSPTCVAYSLVIRG
jgi:hypothetical protein